MSKLSILANAGKYTKATTEALKKGGYHKMNNGATEIINTFSGNNTVKTKTVKQSVNGGWITQQRMEYGDGKVVSFTTKTNRNGSIHSINVVEKGEDGKIIKEIRQNGDSFRASIPRVKAENGEVVKYTQNFDTNPSNIKDVIKPDRKEQANLLNEAIASFVRLG